jgi:hypothetical protein
MEDEPTQCRSGHVYAPYRVLVGFHHCRCAGAVGGGHLTYRCRVEGCGDIRYVGCVDETLRANYRPGPR